MPVAVPSTAGRPYSRATIAACDPIPPASTTTAAARWNSGVQDGLVFGQTSTSPSVRRPNSDGSRMIRTGPVRVIRDPAEFGRLAEGEVLVCPNTNPSWTPLFQRAAAVVVDAGGIGSHAAIVAREYGLPAVLGTVTGTTVLTDGRVVTVDGDAGVVRSAP